MLLSPIKHNYTKSEVNLAEYWDIQLAPNPLVLSVMVAIEARALADLYIMDT